VGVTALVVKMVVVKLKSEVLMASLRLCQGFGEADEHEVKAMQVVVIRASVKHLEFADLKNTMQEDQK